MDPNLAARDTTGSSAVPSPALLSQLVLVNCVYMMHGMVIRPFISLRSFAPSHATTLKIHARWKAQQSQPSISQLLLGAHGSKCAASASTAALPEPPDQPLPPGLYLVGTPIGNLEDITFRALRVLRAADRILCEDTRVTSKLLNYYGVKTPLESYHQHNERSKEGKVLALLQQNAAIALVSDAGMPAINDPGAQLAAAVAAAGLPVIPVPGPSAVLTALVGSGLPTERFTFCGYTPPKASARRKLFGELQGSPVTLLFFAPPHALLGALEDAAAVFGPQRRCCVARELTKLYEEFWRGTLEGALAEFTARGPRGEVTLVVEGAPAGAGAREAANDEEILAALRQAVGEGGLAPSQAAREVARELGANKKHVYALSLGLVRSVQSSE